MAVISTLIFDLDGTLTDPSEGIARSYGYALTRLGLPTPERHELNRHIGPPLREVFGLLLDTDNAARIEHAVGLYREHFATKGLYENQPYDGVHQTIAQLRAAGHRLLLCTSKAQVYAERILSHFALSGYFAGVYGPGLDGQPADKAELLAQLIEREAVIPEQSVMIGDRLHDMRAARRNGTRSIGVLYGFGDHAELVAAGAELTCSRVDEIPGAVARLLA
jgi:phosphoglycolate phosphatase